MARLDSTKDNQYQPFKLKSLMLDLDEYLRIFILPQIPADYKEYRNSMRIVMETAWRAMFKAAVTTGRERQRNLVTLKIEMSMIEVFVREIRDICYRGKEKKKLDKNSEHRFEVLAKKQKEVMMFVWAFSKSTQKSKSNFFKAYLIWMAIGVGIYLIMFVIMAVLGFSMFEVLEDMM